MDCQNLVDERECRLIVRRSLNLSDTEEIPELKYTVRKGSNSLVGFIGEYYNLEITLKETKLKFFIKCVPITNPYLRDECERKGFFVKESFIYSNILSKLRKYVPQQLFPQCYYTRDDILVMEDLSGSYSHIPDNQPFTMSHYQTVLRSLAQFHSASIAWEHEARINIGDQFKDIFREMQFSEANEWFITGVKGIVFLAKRHPKFQSPASQHYINTRLFEFICKARSNVEPSRELRNVLCHRDCWHRNILFHFNSKNQPDHCQFIDFQLTRYSPPGLDILWFLYTTTTPERRAEIFDECLDFYFNSLKDSLDRLGLSQEMISKESFQQDIHRSRLPMLIVWCVCEPLMKMPEGLANTMRAADPQKFDMYLNSERSELFAKVMDLVPGYEEIIMKPIEELLNFIFDLEQIQK